MMVTWIYTKERGIIYSFCLFILLLNLVGLYCIIDLLGYDAIIEYSPYGEEHLGSMRIPSCIIFTVIVINLLFTGSFLIKKNLNA